MPGAAVNEEHLAPPPPRLFTNRDSEALEQYSAAIPWLPPTKEAFDRQFTDPIERILTGGLADPPIKRRNLDDAFYCIASLLPDMISQFTELKDNVIRPSFLILNAVASFAHCATESTELLRSCRTVITREGVARDNIEVTTTVRRVNSFLNAMGKLMAEKKTKCSTLETSLEESARRISGHSSSFDAGLRNMGANWQNACRLYYEASMRSIAALLSAEYRNWEVNRRVQDADRHFHETRHKYLTHLPTGVEDAVIALKGTLQQVQTKMDDLVRRFGNLRSELEAHFRDADRLEGCVTNIKTSFTELHNAANIPAPAFVMGAVENARPDAQAE